MTQGLTELLQKSRLMVVEVDAAHGRLRVKSAADACTDLACGDGTLVVTDAGTGPLETLNPGDIIKVEGDPARPEKIVVLRRVWEELASPEL